MTWDKQSPETAVAGLSSRLLWALGYLLCAAYFLFAHGCHGSGADTELFTSITEE